MKGSSNKQYNNNNNDAKYENFQEMNNKLNKNAYAYTKHVCTKHFCDM